MPKERAILIPLPLAWGAEGPSEAGHRGFPLTLCHGQRQLLLPAELRAQPGGPAEAAEQGSQDPAAPRRPDLALQDKQPQAARPPAGQGLLPPARQAAGHGARPYPAGGELRALEVLQRLAEGNRRGGRA